ncbi:hypothetical protein OH768_28300 [Streptomyces sp. NBC_01622]|uniref:hypothetical protein n=1 Tax=Streptomyces sp. NBC_01622 TaxID=2975903 RepID=UPI00386BBBB4|nr:hypothetical protein OH768_28300 [Streptomyces sp. NBC_01622]
MRRTILPIAAILLTAACSGSPKAGTAANVGGSAAKPLTATSSFTKLSAAVSAAKQSGIVTAANDGNHLLGRPNQYTSKVTFTDSRIKASDVEGTDKGDVDRGGAIEVFADPADAKARAKYIQAVTKSMPVFSEYDYVHGTVLVRVSHYLTPTQAAGYKDALDKLN